MVWYYGNDMEKFVVDVDRSLVVVFGYFLMERFLDFFGNGGV